MLIGPRRYYSPNTGGNEPPADPPVRPPAPPAGDLPAEEAKFTQSQLDAVVRDRLERQKRSVDAAAKAAQEAAETERLKQQGEFEKLADERGRRVAELEGLLRQRDVQAMRDAAAAKHHLPAALAARLVGDTAEALEADAADMAKLVRPEETRRERAQTALGGNPAGPRPAAGNDVKVAQDARDDNARRRSYTRL